MQEKIKIKVQVEGPYLSNPTISINVGQAHFRGAKNKQEIEDIGETTEIHVKVKRNRK